MSEFEYQSTFDYKNTIEMNGVVQAFGNHTITFNNCFVKEGVNIGYYPLDQDIELWYCRFASDVTIGSNLSFVTVTEDGKIIVESYNNFEHDHKDFRSPLFMINDIRIKAHVSALMVEKWGLIQFEGSGELKIDVSGKYGIFAYNSRIHIKNEGKFIIKSNYGIESYIDETLKFRNKFDILIRNRGVLVFRGLYPIETYDRSKLDIKNTGILEITDEHGAIKLHSSATLRLINCEKALLPFNSDGFVCNDGFAKINIRSEKCEITHRKTYEFSFNTDLKSFRSYFDEQDDGRLHRKFIRIMKPNPTLSPIRDDQPETFPCSSKGIYGGFEMFDKIHSLMENDFQSLETPEADRWFFEYRP